jgi:hypothetical protein
MASDIFGHLRQLPRQGKEESHGVVRLLLDAKMRDIRDEDSLSCGGADIDLVGPRPNSRDDPASAQAFNHLFGEGHRDPQERVTVGGIGKDFRRAVGFGLGDVQSVAAIEFGLEVINRIKARIQTHRVETPKIVRGGHAIAFEYT